jgi:TAG lipase / lysophosphatidylethanolamine acyltransferase
MWRLTTFISRLTVLEIQHRLHQLNTLGWLSPSIRRFLLDESVPGSSLTLVPELTPTDFGKLLENPSKETVDYWVLKGERSVWPALSAIKSRVAIEIELDKAYQTVRRRKPSVLISASATSHGALRKSGSQGEVNRQRSHEEGDREERLSRRKRAKSFGDGMGLARMT